MAHFVIVTLYLTWKQINLLILCLSKCDICEKVWNLKVVLFFVDVFVYVRTYMVVQCCKVVCLQPQEIFLKL